MPITSSFLSHSKMDFITFSGAGEPTLHSGIGEIIRFIKSNFPQYKVAVLTNSTVSNNFAGYDGGGIKAGTSFDLSPSGNTVKVTLTNSTVSGNSAGKVVGGSYSESGGGIFVDDSSKLSIFKNAIPTLTYHFQLQ